MIDHSENELELSDHELLDRINDSLCLIRSKNGLTFGTDSYMLAAFIRPQPRERAVELGSGTGVIPLLLLARNKIGSVTAAEIQPYFADLIRRNADINGMSERLTPLCHDIRELTSRELGGEVALVFSNPPYMRTDSGRRNEHDEKYVARHEVFGGIADFCACAARLLKYGGRFACVWRPDRLSELFTALHDAGLEPKRMALVYADETSEPCAALIESVKGGAHGMRVLPPIILYLPDEGKHTPRRLTPQAQKIYDTCTVFD